MNAIICCLPTFGSLAMAQDNVNYCHNDTAFQTQAVIIFYSYPRASPFDEYTMTAEYRKIPSLQDNLYLTSTIVLNTGFRMGYKAQKNIKIKFNVHITYFSQWPCTNQTKTYTAGVTKNWDP